MKITFLEPLGLPTEYIKSELASVLTDQDELMIYSDRVEDLNVIIERSQGADMVIASNIPMPAAYFEAVDSIKYVGVAFAGVDHVDVDYCQRKGIKVRNAAGYCAQAVAELTLALMIDMLRHIVRLDNTTKMGRGREGFLGRQLSGKCIGIIGMGKIGETVVELLRPFHCNILAYSRSVKSIEGVTFCSLETLCRESDIITIHVPLTIETEHLIGKEELALMKKNVQIINTARGKVMDYAELSKFLENNLLAGAALDVYETEPPLSKEYPLFGRDNITFLPHIGYATEEAFENRLELMKDAIVEFKTK